jgi:hypothetical protein
VGKPKTLNVLRQNSIRSTKQTTDHRSTNMGLQTWVACAVTIITLWISGYLLRDGMNWNRRGLERMNWNGEGRVV